MTTRTLAKRPSVLANRMSPDDYEAERARLREAYGDSNKEAGARFEQELARLFYRSGWTQEELAKKEGLKQPTVCQRLQFGRFLDFIASGNKTENPAFSKLTERRFRAPAPQQPV